MKLGILQKPFGLILLISLTACATTKPVPLGTRTAAPSKTDVKSPISDISDAIGESNIVFIRRHAEPTAFPVSVIIEGEKVATLNQKQFTAFSLPQGNYYGQTKWGLLSAQAPIYFDLNVEGPDIHYFEILAEYDVDQNIIGDLTDVVAIRNIPPEEGINYLSNCCTYKAPKIAN